MARHCGTDPWLRKRRLAIGDEFDRPNSRVDRSARSSLDVNLECYTRVRADDSRCYAGAFFREGALAPDHYREVDVLTSAGPARGLSRCLSRMRGNSHLRFLGGRAGAILPGYPTFEESR